ncbi:glutamyl-tRNA(Gln) amidotransferase subunit C 2 [Clostridium pasteurianum DSM 525 = ATCC 6013]|uniref:Aspartyl/glutamyl-tRNA(Asn/Gln) amidotransferase subunit C n=1 Tax=Clostridium pasteurianum DSM 525 = ATCC 6013 TaxID=1262449 RepID=A0A0H3IXT0_CLOPA|nr:Asp-tRNA(Asn)/Glu-tRNA(Gln) amidotransferase subunit GatC [Clostridium pasteurianum]AJA46281.1 glutamyl-tRNA(Gln) amidotransferase subunit C 2 [Clostridium pasteurianum DSM 525 = ATCC 6013]AJA50269.1 glutamyl-tRNA(Gln) amidotransferase subunit C 2 [Clostridium pasteurianum DSM 525 = ATCC 6013]AOZ73733.1 glutamyl-tRNA amidotransferase [Clostridium pasteurianum DSM 525 = ATCC 6013]AOZ77530.1 glutamyl-tRNA amidotransferase [Clostridium pasteurianum]ELP60865.1 glutamyl-tRNA(Gln) amidotransferas
MEHVSVEEVKHIAKLSKLSFTEEETLKIAKEFEAILTHFKTIDNLDLEDVNLNEYDEVNTEFRKDIPQIFEDKKKLMQNVKNLRDGGIQVPKIIE